jgi:glycosyltransferase involved in cell wall biosynthesis
MQESLRSLASGLVARGCEVVVVSSALPDGASSLEEGGVEFHFVDDTTPESYERGFFEKIYAEFDRLNTAEPFDLVFSESVAAAGLCRRISIPLVARFHGIWVGWRPSESLYFPDVWRVLRAREKTQATRGLPSTFYYGTRLSRLARLVCETASKVVLDSEYSRGLLQQRMPELDRGRVLVVPPSVDTERFSPRGREADRDRLGFQRPTLLFVSRMTIAKGPRVAMQAVEALDPSVCDLIMVGEGRESAPLERYVATKKIDHIRFAGLVPADDLPAYFRAADLLIYPELSSPAFGLVGAEALACETPVIGSDAGAIPEVIGDCGYLFPRGDVESLTRLIPEALAAQAKLEAMGRRGRQRVIDRFSRQKMIEMMSTAFEDALETGHQAR